MGLLDDVPDPRYVPPRYRTKKYHNGYDERGTGFDPEEGRLSELNNDGRAPVTEDYEDSPFADRKEEKDDQSEAPIDI